MGAAVVAQAGDLTEVAAAAVLTEVVLAEARPLVMAEAETMLCVHYPTATGPVTAARLIQLHGRT